MGVEDYNKEKLERLREHKIAFDQEAMWAAMQKKKKRRGAFFFFTMALVALAIVFFTYCLFSRFNGENSKFNVENISKTELSNITNIKNEERIVDNANEIGNIEGDINDHSNLTKPDLEDSNDHSDSIDASIKNQVSGEYKTDSAHSNENEKSIVSNIEDTKSTEISHLNNQTNLHLTTNENSKTGNVVNNQNTGQEIESNKQINNNLENFISIQPLKVFEFPYLESLKDQPIDFDLEITPLLITEVITKPKSRFHIGVYGGIGYLFRKTTLENEALELENETLEEVSIGLELKYQLAPNFFVRSGLEYWHATERRETSTFSISNAMDQTVIIVGEEKGIIITTSYSKIHTMYRSYNIPIVLGWNTNNAKWNVFIEAGLLYNFKTDSKRDESLVNNEIDIYNVGSRNQISPIMGIGFSFSPSNKVELFARSNWRGNQSVTISETPETLKFGAIRTQLGMRIGF
jgi:hypothetical protein